MKHNFTLVLPREDGHQETVVCKRSILLLGANGSGKTRLGTWIEFHSPQNRRVHRISAQKSLAMPDTTTPVSIERAENDLLFGHAEIPVNQGTNYKNGHKWHGKPAIMPLNDFQKLMVYLFSDHTEESAKYLAASKATNLRVNPPITKLEQVKRVWEKILPHRELILGGLRVQTRVKENASQLYNSSEMSDGERVIFYLIGQCLAAQKDGIIIIDEPELHLHKSVQAPLWAEIEKLRSDCLFVYLTHDVDFAASQEGAKKVWLKAFDGSTWDWQIIDEVNGLPEELLLEVLGSRKPVVFVEGDTGSYDVALYRAILDKFLVIPRGGCMQVIQSVKALKDNNQLHHLDICGIVDRDRRGEEEIEALEADGIFVLEVAEVESLFCTRETLEFVSTRLARDPQKDLENISHFLFSLLQEELENQISLRASAEIKFQLNQFNEKAKGEEQLATALTNLVQSLNVSKVYEDSKLIFDGLFADHNFDSLIKFYNRKSLPSQISRQLGLSNGELAEFIVRLARGNDVDEIRNRLKKYFGNFARHLA